MKRRAIFPAVATVLLALAAAAGSSAAFERPGGPTATNALDAFAVPMADVPAPQAPSGPALAPSNPPPDAAMSAPLWNEPPAAARPDRRPAFDGLGGSNEVPRSASVPPGLAGSDSPAGPRDDGATNRAAAARSDGATGSAVPDALAAPDGSTATGAAAMSLMMGGGPPPPSPHWWIARGVLDTNASPNDFAPVNQGQAKWVARQAYEDFNSLTNHLPGGAGSAISNLVAGFSTNNNYFLLNQGQLKHLAQPFYDRLHAVGWTNALPAGMPGLYPWTAATNDDRHYSPALLGQLKHVFSFDPEACIDTDGDGLSDRDERLAGTDPEIPDYDSDGMLDGWEVANGLNPLWSGDAALDPDNDGYGNLQEYLLGMRPNAPAVAGSLGLCVLTPIER